MKKTNSDKQNFLEIFRSLDPSAICVQQLLLHYQIPQYDRHHFPVTGILLIFKSLSPNEK